MIYLLEDDESIRKLVVYALRSQEVEARGFEEPSAFWAAMKREKPDLVLLDIMLPGEDGISILKKLRSSPATASLPVIMLTAKNSEYDRVEGLDAGADDYISKPFGMMELAARIRALLRRTDSTPAASEYRIGALYVCPDRHEIRVNGEPVALTMYYLSYHLLCNNTKYNMFQHSFLVLQIKLGLSLSTCHQSLRMLVHYLLCNY